MISNARRVIALSISLVLKIPPFARAIDRALRLFPSVHLYLFEVATGNSISAHNALRPGQPLPDEPEKDHEPLADIELGSLTRRGEQLATCLVSTNAADNGELSP